MRTLNFLQTCVAGDCTNIYTLYYLVPVLSSYNRCDIMVEIWKNEVVNQNMAQLLLEVYKDIQYQSNKMQRNYTMKIRSYGQCSTVQRNYNTVQKRSKVPEVPTGITTI